MTVYEAIHDDQCKKTFYFNMLGNRIIVYYHQTLKFMYVLHVSLHVMLVLKHSRANVTLEGLDVTNTMDSGQVSVQVAFLCKLPAANFTVVSGVRMLSSATAALSMRRVVVSADR